MPKIAVIYKDDYLLALDKPAGVVANRVASNKEPSLQDWVRERFPLSGTGRDFVSRSGLAHRLDKDTSGIILFALAEDAFLNLQRQFKRREIKKEYLALAHGVFSRPVGRFDFPLARSKFNPLQFVPDKRGRQALTAYQALGAYRIPGKFLPRRFSKSKDALLNMVSLLRVFPLTGRTHQIRAHFKASGHPLVGDRFYGYRKIKRYDFLWCPRLFLHARSVAFRHPRTGRVLRLVSPLPRELETVLQLLYNSQG